MPRNLSVEEQLTNLQTMQHIMRVQQLMMTLVQNIQQRALVHDLSKLDDPELPIFTEYTAKLKTVTYGSPEYKQFLVDMKPALDNHYAQNSHHPEHHDQGIKGMTLLDVLEMLCDWKASTERTKDGDIVKSLAIQKDRFGISDELLAILHNTLREFE